MDRIEPRFHDEIKDYREKFYNFTLRQWIFGILILITTIPLYLILSPIGNDIAGWVVILIALPIGFIGFIPIQQLPAEKIIFYWKRNYINFAKPILYKIEETIIEKNNKKTIINNLNKKDQKNIKKIEKKEQKRLQKERQRQREIARAKKKFGINNLENSKSDFSLSQEEAQILLKLAKQVVGKEDSKVNESEAKEKNESQ